MVSKKDVHTLLRTFAIRKKSQNLDFPEFVTFAQKYAEQKQSENPSLASLTSDTEIQLVTQIEDLSGDKRCSIIYDQGKIGTIVYPEFFSQLVKKRYQTILEEPDTPFPTPGTLEIEIPSESITEVDVKGEFVNVMEKAKEGDATILKLNFPDGINSFIVSSELLKTQLLKTCVAKTRLYLNTQKNASYMLSKLRSVFPAREQQLREMISKIVTQRGGVLESIAKPTEFTFSFWTNLANAIIKEYREKTTKLEREQGFCQAAYLIGFYNVFNKGKIRKQKDVQAALRILDKKLVQPPYVFTVTDIADFKDNNGILLTKKYTQEQLHEHLDGKTTPKDSDSLPEVLRLKTADRKEYFVAKEVVLPLTAKKVQAASVEYKNQYIEEWMSCIEQLKKVKEMKSDEAFITQLESRVKKSDPLLSALLSYELLYLLLQDTKASYEVSQRINRFLDTSHSRLIPLDEILRLNRRDLVAQAKSNLPFWKSMPFFNRLFTFLGSLATGSKKSKKKRKGRGGDEVPEGVSGAKLLGAHTVVSETPEGGSKSSGRGGKDGGRVAQTQALQNAMAKLKIEFVGSASLQESINGLTERWNPLFDPQAKANLVEDVNSLVRDFLRKLKKGFLVKPPDAPRIQNMATSLAENHAFDQIKHRDALQRYIELYMIKILGGK